MGAQAPARDRGLEPYLRAIRARIRVVALVLAVALAASAVLVATHSPAYETSSKLLIDAWPQSDTSALDVGLLRETGDPTRTLETAVALIESNASASAAAKVLGTGWTAERVKEATRVEVDGESNVVELVARADSPAEAARVANGLAEGVLQSRASAFERRVAQATEQAESQLADRESLSEEAITRLSDRLSQLQALQAGGDPTIVLADAAREPEGVSGAPSWLLAVLSLIAATVIALGAALLLEMLDPRVQDEDDITSAYALHVLASVPRLSRRERRRAADSPLEVVVRLRETFRTVLVQIEQMGRRMDSGPIVMFTSPSRADGKTTTALNFALTAAEEGHRVILLDLDMHEHDLTRRLGLIGQAASASALADPDVSLDELLVQTEVPNLRVLPTRNALDIGLAGAFMRRLSAVLSQAMSMADRVVIDTAPLGEVSDPLRIAVSADHVLLVSRPGNTNRRQLELARDLLERSAAPVRGIVVVGSREAGANGYGYGYGYGYRSAMEDAADAAQAPPVTTSS
jgi:Mrp family chromosome partitioning ATPase